MMSLTGENSQPINYQLIKISNNTNLDSIRNAIYEPVKSLLPENSTNTAIDLMINAIALRVIGQKITLLGLKSKNCAEPQIQYHSFQKTFIWEILPKTTNDSIEDETLTKSVITHQCEEVLTQLIPPGISANIPKLALSLALNMNYMTRGYPVTCTLTFKETDRIRVVLTNAVPRKQPDQPPVISTLDSWISLV